MSKSQVINSMILLIRKYNDFHFQIRYEVNEKKQIHIQSHQAHDAAQTAQTHKRQLRF